MLGAVPIYYKTDDKRILAYLRKNARAHELKTGKSTVGLNNLYASIPVKSNGTVRRALKDGAAITLFILVVTLIGVAVGG